MLDRVFSEGRDLFAEGGPFFWWLVALAFGIAFALISIWRSLETIAAADQNFAGSPEEWARRYFDPPARRIPFAFVLIGAAPLIGLLGTVSGMLATFGGMAGRDGGLSAADAIAGGISEALITTEAGLVIGVPTYILCVCLKSRLERLRLEYERRVCSRSMTH